MSVTRTPALNLPYLRNDNRLGDVFTEMLRSFDVLLQGSAKDKDLTAPPSSPAQGDTYIVGGSATGAWSGYDNYVATYWGSSWVFYTPQEGWVLWLDDEDGRYTYDGSVWSTTTVTISDGSITFAKLAAAAVVLESEGISSNDNDTTLPTSAAVKDYADTAIAAAVASYQPLDSDLTAIASLTTTSYGRSVLELADASAAQTLFDVDPSGTDNSTNVSLAGSYDYLTIAGQVITLGQIDLAADVTGALPAASVSISDAGLLITATTVEGALAENRAAIDAIEADYLVAADIATSLFDSDIGGSVQAWAATLDSWAAITRATGFDTFVATPSSANLRGLLTDETGTGPAVFASSPTLVTPILGTPTSGTLTNCTGLPISTGVSGLATGIAAFLATPSSANLATAVTDETGTGALVFATAPSFTTSIKPASNDGASLGISGTAWSDLYLASGGVINWNSGLAALTESSGALLYDGKDFYVRRSDGTVCSFGIGRLDTHGSGVLAGRLYFNGKSSTGVTRSYAEIAGYANNSTNAAEQGDLLFYLMKAGTLTHLMQMNIASLFPASNDLMGLGNSSYSWSDLFLASGAVVNFNAGDVTITHAANALVLSGGNLYNSSSSTPASSNVAGWSLLDTGVTHCSIASNPALYVNRVTDDGAIINIMQAGTVEGTISTSGTTVSYNAFMGSHWSQSEGDDVLDLKRGTVVETIDALCDWPGEENDRLPKYKVSDTPGSKRVYGVFLAIDTDDEHLDSYIAALGASWIRIAAGHTVQGGDLLESNGDGCARVQADDVIRSSTIGKVTSTTVVETYDDGSYLVPCVLYCG